MSDATLLQALRGQLETQAQQQAQSDAAFRLLVEAIEDYAICMLDPSGRVATWNAGAQRLLGHSPDEIIGRHCSAFHLEEERCARSLDLARQTGKVSVEGWCARKDGSRFWASVILTAIRDPGGALLGFANVTRDLTERKLAQEDQRTEAERFRLLVDSVRDYAIFMLDPRGIVTTWNVGAERIKGYRADEIIGRHFSTFYLREEVEAGKCEMELEVAAHVGRFEDEGWRVRKDGSRFWANVVITALRQPGGELIGFGKVTRDLTERRSAEQARLAAEERFRRLVESVKDYAIFILDPAGHVATWNAGAERIKGYAAGEIIGSHFSRFYPEEDVRSGKCEMELEVAAREGRFEDEGWRVRKDGTWFWANVVISAIRDDEARLVGFSKVTRDLTERKRSEEERGARLAAEEANRAKDEFLAMLGHELRNPLAPIVTALQLIKLRANEKSMREHQIIERQVAQMTRLVDDLLDVSRIARGKLELKREPIDIRDTLAKAIEIASPAFERKAQHFEVKTPGHPLVLDGDRARLVQVFANLLNNAAKYTERGGHIFVLVRQLKREILVEVRDDGTGIDPALLPRIFELFVQGTQDAARAEGGLGLGLTLVKQIVQLHGGEVEARSNGRGLGSSFTVRLPAAQEANVTDADELPALAPDPSPGARRILVVDDNDDARTLLADLLVALGHEVRAASDGPEALAVLEDLRPEVAILDIGLPGMDGFELASRIREARGGELQLIALSGYGQPKDRARAEQAGFDAHLVKPVDMNRLLELVRSPRRDGRA
jgi:PAS domain S-box-containing protein